MIIRSTNFKKKMLTPIDNDKFFKITVNNNCSKEIENSFSNNYWLVVSVPFTYKVGAFTHSLHNAWQGHEYIELSPHFHYSFVSKIKSSIQGWLR